MKSSILTPTGRSFNQLWFTIAGFLRAIVLVLLVPSSSALSVKQPQQLTWGGVQGAVLEFATPYPLSAASSSGLPVSLRVQSGPAQIEGGMLVVTNTGTVWVIAEQTGDDIHAPAQLTRSFNVRNLLASRTSYRATDGYAADLKVVGRYAYVAAGESGFHIYDISLPASPVKLGTLDTPGNATALKLIGNLAYVADGDVLQIIDIRNPAAPARIGGQAFPEGCVAVDVFADHLYSLGESSLEIMEITAPGTVAKVGHFDFRLNWPDSLENVEAANGQVFVTERFNGPAGIFSDSIFAVDVSNPVQPVLLHEGPPVSFPGAADRSRAPLKIGTYRFGPGESLIIWDWDRTPFGLPVFDESNLASPLPIGGIPTSGNPNAVQISGDYAYLATWNGLEVWHLRWGYPQVLSWTAETNAPLSPRVSHPFNVSADSHRLVTLQVDAGPALWEAGVLNVTNAGTVWLTAEQGGDARYLPIRETRAYNVRRADFNLRGRLPTGGRNIRLVGDRVYAAAGLNGLKIMDLSHPDAPAYLGGFNTDGQTEDVEIIGDYAYLADGFGGLKVIHVKDPASPSEVARINSGGWLFDLEVGGHYVYAVSQGGFEVFDVQDPAKPVRVGTYSSDWTVGFRLAGQTAYLIVIEPVEGKSLLQAVDVRDPEHLTASGIVIGPDYYLDCQVSGDHAYLLMERSMRILDLRNPHTESPVSEFFIQDLPSSMKLADGYAYITTFSNPAQPESTSGMAVIDVSNPASPFEVGRVELPGNPDAVDVYGNVAFLAGRIVEIRLGIPQIIQWPELGSVPFPSYPWTLNARSSSGLPLVFSVISGPARVEDGQLALTGLGLVRIRGEQPGNEEVLAVTDDWSFVVTPPNLNIRQVGGQIELAWPTGAPELKLGRYDSLSPVASVRQVTLPQLEIDGEIRVRVEVSAQQEYFRLFLP